MLALTENPIAEQGHAALEVKMVFGESTVTSASATSPLKLLTPRSRGQSVWAYTSSFGGGLVAGDQTRLELQLGQDTRCFVGTQASSKIYRNPARLPSGHVTRAILEENSLLVFAPDPVQAFADSIYTQRQEFYLAPGAGLALVDWFTSGRAACGERWQFNQFESRNEVWSAPHDSPVEPRSSRRKEAHTISGEESQSLLTSAATVQEKTVSKRVFLDSLLLDQTASALTSSHRLGRFNCIAMLLLIGEPMREAAAQLLKDISTQSVPRRAPLVSSASPVRDGAMLRIAGESVEEVGRELHRHVQVLAVLLGDDPWARKW